MKRKRRGMVASKAKLARMAAYRSGWADRDAQAREQIARLRAKIRLLKYQWDEKCPKGHLVRHDECDLVDCYVTILSPIKTHEWIIATYQPTEKNVAKRWACRIRKMFRNLWRNHATSIGTASAGAP